MARDAVVVSGIPQRQSLGHDEIRTPSEDSSGLVAEHCMQGGDIWRAPSELTLEMSDGVLRNRASVMMMRRDDTIDERLYDTG
jgi:hypothetical protein